MSNNDANSCISIPDAGNENTTTSNMVDSTRLLRRTIVTNDDVEVGSADSTIPICNQQGLDSVSFHNVARPVRSSKKHVHMFWFLLVASILITFWSTANSSKVIKDEMSDTTLQAFEPYNSTNPHEKSWCPSAACNNSPLCLPCKKRFLFIIATGRSGSTTLLSMLNHLPGVSEELVTSIMPYMCSTETLTYINIDRILNIGPFVRRKL